MPLVTFSPLGLYCEQGDFFIDPYRSVSKALITHAHSDHARYGSQHYLCHTYTEPLLKLRLGNVQTQSIAWGQTITINGVNVSFHPAGHVIGSSQIRLEYKGEIWVISGDYKVEFDGITQAFEPVTCHNFLTESTFALPVFNWDEQAQLQQSMQTWISSVMAKQKVPVLKGYSLGKAQRLVYMLQQAGVPIYVHPTIYKTQEVLQQVGFNFSYTQPLTQVKDIPKLQQAVVILPPSINTAEHSWADKIEVANCSGWMQIKGNYKRSNVNRGFAISDHADWKGLLQAIQATQAKQVFVTHGYQSILTKYLIQKGLDAREVKTQFDATGAE